MVQDIPAILYLGGWGLGAGGWGPGAAWLRTGTEVWLTKTDDQSVRFLAGVEPEGPPGVPREGREFPIEHLLSCKDLPT